MGCGCKKTTVKPNAGTKATTNESNKTSVTVNTFTSKK